MTTQLQQHDIRHREAAAFQKAKEIAATRRIHRSAKTDIWMIEASKDSDRPFYKVQYVDVDKGLVCDCKSYQHGGGAYCLHGCLVLIREFMASYEQRQKRRQRH